MIISIYCLALPINVVQPSFPHFMSSVCNLFKNSESQVLEGNLMSNNIVPVSSALKRVVLGFGLSKPGDELQAYVTKTGREVLKVRRDNGKDKQSITHYPSTGTFHVTQTFKEN